MTRYLASFLAAATVLIAGCAQPPAAATQASLLGTYWSAVEIEGVPYAAWPGTREPHLVFSGEGSRVRGFTGCNNLTGAFEQDAERLRFKPLATTRMACLPENEVEGQFTSALGATATQRIAGNTLELRDRDGKVRMRLEGRGPAK
jgi:heat shock protein HslJ